MKDSNWNYNDGEFYLGFGGTAIVYLEQNPCGCCPNSVFREVKYLGYTRGRFFHDLLRKYARRF